MKKRSKVQRQKELVDMLKTDPFYTDEELAEVFSVSVQTIRLDRMSLNIPELRERVKNIAESQSTKVRTLGMKEITGEIIDISVGELGISMLEVNEDMIYSKTGTLKDAYIFSLAESLAMAIIDTPKVIMRVANIKCEDMIYSKTGTLKDAYIFSLAESLAMAIIDTPKVIMRVANIKC